MLYSTKKNRWGGPIARIELDTKWSPTKPWLAYYNGTATGSFPTLEKAKEYFVKDYGIGDWEDVS